MLVFFDVKINAAIIKGDLCLPNCLIQACDEQEYSVEGPTIGFVFDTIPGYLDFKLDASRINFGHPDNDDYNLPDPSGVPSYDGIS